MKNQPHFMSVSRPVFVKDGETSLGFVSKSCALHKK